MKAIEAINELKNKKTLQDDEYYYSYVLPNDEDIEYLGDGEDVYRFRKSSGEFISFDEFLEIKANFIILDEKEEIGAGNE
jgi:hypothetical protein